jgi:LysM repeat protein
LAPVAVVTCAVAVYAVASSSLKDDSPASESTKSTQRAVPTQPTSRKTTTKKRRYVVKSGDTLSAISIKTGVPLATIERLNPKLDADTLHAGQKVRLAP